MSPGPRILIIRFSSLGDVVLATPLVRAIHARHPEAVLPYLGRSGVLERPLACRRCGPLGNDHCPLGHQCCMIEIAPAAADDAVERAA